MLLHASSKNFGVMVKKMNHYNHFRTTEVHSRDEQANPGLMDSKSRLQVEDDLLLPNEASPPPRLLNAGSFLLR
ncbi:hypothetical protein EXN66_Car014253 [Channa argus]|uniref:Uncharacterized protein n=1 Tax=Channa argus TaxID=215402 RepID=A0A6G1Q8S6_CHAAH|nr:hypothetical protein EXN66_Car014253 [Channa argus]